MWPSTNLDAFRNVDRAQNFFDPVDRRAMMWWERKPTPDSSFMRQERGRFVDAVYPITPWLSRDRSLEMFHRIPSSCRFQLWKRGFLVFLDSPVMNSKKHKQWHTLCFPWVWNTAILSIVRPSFAALLVTADCVLASLQSWRRTYSTVFHTARSCGDLSCSDFGFVMNYSLASSQNFLCNTVFGKASIWIDAEILIMENVISMWLDCWPVFTSPFMCSCSLYL